MNGQTVLAATAVASIALVTSLIASSAVASRAYVKRGAQESDRTRTLEVTGSAKARIRSDLALWTIRARGEGKTVEEAYGRLDATCAAVRGFLRQRGFPEEGVTAGSISTRTHYRVDDKGRETRDVVSYELARSFQIRSEEPDRVHAASGEVTELLRSGALVSSDEPDYVYTKLADLKVRMIGEATANGRERADRIAEGSRCRIGGVRDARAGILQITPPWSTEVSSGGMNDTSSIEKDVTAVVHLTFAIEAD
ncbi:MAG: SIMPL domain-containing protein [Planctomycetia bacterium]|nr:SIMPL domain-containing protein [Planctomycetia bacterium]